MMMNSVRRLALLAGAALLGSTSPTLADGTVAGRATFNGTPPPPKPLNVASDKHCAAHARPVSEDFVVASDGAIANVLVYVKDGLPEGKEYPPPAEPVVVDQVGCRYTPHVVALQVGQPLKVTNGDPTMHNVHGIPRNSSEFNVVQGQKGAANTFTFKEPERGFALKCDVHPWMKAYVWVLPNPYFALSGPDGKFTLPKLPPGEYTIAAWHEKAGTREQKIKVEDGKQADVAFTFEAKKAAR